MRVETPAHCSEMSMALQGYILVREVTVRRIALDRLWQMRTETPAYCSEMSTGPQGYILLREVTVRRIALDRLWQMRTETPAHIVRCLWLYKAIY